MREGTNPNKKDNQIVLKTHHRVIMVVYIPHENDFYKESFDVFTSSLQSLILTQHHRSAITVIDNGCIPKVKRFLQQKLDDGEIDQLIIHRENIGKIDAIIGAARGVREPLITLTDADVLFLKDWQHKVEDVFAHIPHTGAVSPICMRYSALHATTAVIRSIFTRKLRYRLASFQANFQANQRFMQSVNWVEDQSDEHLYPIIEYRGFKCIMGAPHQVITLRREVFFTAVPSQPCFLRMGGDSVVKYIDYPVDALGLYRFSTYGNYAYHMGNRIEDWMKESVNELHKQEGALASKALELPPLKKTASIRPYSEQKRFFWRKMFKKFIGLNYQTFPAKMNL